MREVVIYQFLTWNREAIPGWVPLKVRDEAKVAENRAAKGVAKGQTYESADVCILDQFEDCAEHMVLTDVHFIEKVFMEETQWVLYATFCSEGEPFTSMRPAEIGGEVDVIKVLKEEMASLEWGTVKLHDNPEQTNPDTGESVVVRVIECQPRPPRIVQWRLAVKNESKQIALAKTEGRLHKYYDYRMGLAQSDEEREKFRKLRDAQSKQAPRARVHAGSRRS